ncbi:MAG: hypothetical protein DRJ03_26520 [Chloroflexi bacterium]|nr:MAG: hypothetical protein DRJ03_26520 [Chloroflexota bacterium]
MSLREIVFDIETNGFKYPVDILMATVLEIKDNGLHKYTTLSLRDFDDNYDFLCSLLKLMSPDGYDELKFLLNTQTTLITFNGKKFDLPVLRDNLLRYGVEWYPVKYFKHVDIYDDFIRNNFIRSPKTLGANKLESVHARYIGGGIDIDDISGSDFPDLYKEAVEKGDEDLHQLLVDYNQQDVRLTLELYNRFKMFLP